MIKLSNKAFDGFTSQYISEIKNLNLKHSSAQIDLDTALKKVWQDPNMPQGYQPNDEDKFLELLLINPFSDERKNFLLLKDYYIVMKLLYETHNKHRLYKKLGQRSSNYQDIRKSTLNDYLSNISNVYFVGSSITQQNLDDIASSEKKYTAFLNTVKSQLEDLNKLFRKVINYEYIDDHIRVEIIQYAGIEVCPYCNRQYIHVYKDHRGSDTAEAHIDHFFPKAQFPLYSLSLYNFVPICGHCNQKKSSSLLPIEYPYVDYAEMANSAPYFSLEYEDVSVLKGYSNEFEIGFASDNLEINASAYVLNHKGLYKNHKEFAKRMLRNRQLNNLGYLEHINQYLSSINFNIEGSKGQLTEKGLRDLLFGFYGENDQKELKQKPLSKLAHDILDLNKK